MICSIEKRLLSAFRAVLLGPPVVRMARKALIRSALVFVVWLLTIPGSRAAAEEPGSITLSPATSRIVASEDNRELAEWLAKEIASAAAVRVPIISDNRVDESTWRSYHLILIGNLNDNQATARLYYDYKAFLDAAFPGQGGLMVKTLVNPLGYGKNVILVGGSNKAGTRAAVKRFVSMASSHGTELPALHAVMSKLLPQTTITEEQAEEIAKRNRQNFEAGGGSLSNIIGYGSNFYFTTDPIWARLFKRSLLDYISIAKQRGDWLFDPLLGTHFRLASLINIWDLIEDSKEFTPNERKTITSAFWEMAQYVSRLSYVTPLANPPGEVRQNHSTFLGLSLDAAIRYFGRRGYKEVFEWNTITDRIFGGQLRSYRSDDDAGNYMWYAPLHTFDYFQRQGSELAQRKGFLDRLADLAVIVTDNRRDPVTFGDVQAYTPWEKNLEMTTIAEFSNWPVAATVLARAVWAHHDPVHQWAYQWLTERKRIDLTRLLSAFQPMRLYATDLPAVEPTRLVGISQVLLDAAPIQWVASRVIKPSWLPREGVDYLDKLSLRSSFDPRDEYLLLDGIGAFAHGHKDANAILRLTWQDRIWLADLDYTRRQPRHNNSIDVARDGRTGVLPPLAELAVEAELGEVGLVRSDLVDYNGMDWSRNLIWSKGEYFVVIDELRARQSGEYDMRCYWRTLGEVKLEGRELEVSQPGAYFRVINADASIPSLSRVDPVLEARTQLGNWSAYAYADGVVQVLTQRQQARLSPGQSRYFMNLLYARPQGKPSDLTMKQLTEGVVLIEGEEKAVLAGVGPQRQLGNVSIEAALFQLGQRSLSAAELTYLRTTQGWLSTDRPIDVALDNRGRGRLIVEGPTEVKVSGAWHFLSEGVGREAAQGLRTVQLSRGEHEVELKAPIFSAEEFSVLAASARAMAVRGESEAVSFGLQREWSTEAGSDVRVMNRSKMGAGWVLGLRDGRVLQLDPTGRTQLVAQRPAEVRAIVQLQDGRLVVGDREGAVTAFRKDGRIRWRQQFNTYWGYRERVVSLLLQPWEKGDRLLVGTEAPRVHALDLEGKLQWSTPASGTTESSSQGRAIEWWGALTQLKTADLDGDGRQEIVAGTEYKIPIVVLDAEGFLRLLTWRWGGSESRAETPFVGINAIVVEVAELQAGAGPSIVYGTETDEVYVLNAEGEPRWSTNVGGEVNALAVYDLDDDGRQEVMAATGSGYLVLLDHEGKRLWWRQHSAGLTTLALAKVEQTNSPIIAVGSTTGALYAYSPQGDLLAVAREKGAISQLDLQSPGWGQLTVATNTGKISHWRILPQRRFSRSSRHHY